MNRVTSLLLLLCAFEAFAAESELPPIPIGLDAYRMWDKWPHHRIGARAYMRSTYDRRGGNEGADASHFLYQLADDFNVTLDVAGPGMLYFVRCNHWHGSPWHYEVDGTDHIVQETSSADPTKPVPDSIFIPEKLFPNPLTWTWSITKGADLNWVPMAFEKTFRLGYSRTRYGTGYYIYHLYDRAAKLSQPLRSWDDKTVPEKGVLDLISRSGTDLIADLQGLRADEVVGKERASVLELSGRGPTVIRGIDISAPRRDAVLLGRGRIRITWDNRPHASIDAPISLFFGAGTLYNRDGREYLVKAFPMNIRYDSNRVHLACYFPMPFFESAKIELIDHVPDTRLKVRSLPLKDPHVGYFHATYRDHGKPTPGHDLVLLDTRSAEGGGDWAGNFVGTSWIFSQRGVLNTLEGDPRFFFDDSGSPQAYGTGTEEWGGGGDYWGGRNMTLPFAGHPCGAISFKEAKEPEDLIQSAYRFLLADLMPFGKNAIIQLEHGGNNESTEHYETVTYWYGSPGATLVQTDELKIGDIESEKKHEYHSPDASEPYEITSRYEWGVDRLHGKTTYPSHTERGRKTSGASEFTLQIDPKNLGVLLRRKLDYSFPNQRAQISILNRDGKTWDAAGIWYLAGANTCIYSNPPDELGATQHNVQTSNRQFRDDEFLIPRDLTAGHDKIRVQVRFTPVTIPLFPGHAFGTTNLAWSEIRYKAYSYRFPAVAAEVTRR